MRHACWIAIVLPFSACGPVGAAFTDGNRDVPDLAPPPEELISHDYSLEPGQERFLCVRKTLTRDLLISEITPTSAAGTHHQLLGVDPKRRFPDGAMGCDGDAEFDIAAWQLLYASGVNSPPLVLPPGTAIALHAGDQIVLQMHLLNAAPRVVAGSAALHIRTLPAGASPSLVQMILAGVLPVPSEERVIAAGPNQRKSGRCTMPSATRLIAEFPHMHRLGRHIEITAMGRGANAPIYDADYRFDDQRLAQFPPVELGAGDQIRVTCTYDNDTGHAVDFGQSSKEEMCFAISFVSPPVPINSPGNLCTE